jgi:hypothetical protein
MMRMKKNCEGCRALWYDGHGSYTCQLSYQIKHVEKRAGGIKHNFPVPVEVCPKPRTWQARFNAEVKK